MLYINESLYIMNQLVTVNQHWDVPDWLHWEVNDIVDLTQSLVWSINKSNFPEKANIQYNKDMWDSIVSIIHRMHISRIINATQRGELMRDFSHRAHWEDGINYPFYFLDSLYSRWFFHEDSELFEQVRNILMKFSYKTQPSDILRILSINSAQENETPELEKDSNQQEVMRYTIELNYIISIWSQDNEVEFINAFSEFLFAESILDWKKFPNITEAKTAWEMWYEILLELLLADHYLEHESIMIEVWELLISYYQKIWDEKQERYVLDYISSYSDTPLKYRFK